MLLLTINALFQVVSADDCGICELDGVSD